MFRRMFRHSGREEPFGESVSSDVLFIGAGTGIALVIIMILFYRWFQSAAPFYHPTPVTYIIDDSMVAAKNVAEGRANVSLVEGTTKWREIPPDRFFAFDRLLTYGPVLVFFTRDTSNACVRME